MIFVDISTHFYCKCSTSMKVSLNQTRKILSAFCSSEVTHLHLSPSNILLDHLEDELYIQNRIVPGQDMYGSPMNNYHKNYNDK